MLSKHLVRACTILQSYIRSNEPLICTYPQPVHMLDLCCLHRTGRACTLYWNYVQGACCQACNMKSKLGRPWALHSLAMRPCPSHTLRGPSSECIGRRGWALLQALQACGCLHATYSLAGGQACIVVRQRSGICLGGGSRCQGRTQELPASHSSGCHALQPTS